MTIPNMERLGGWNISPSRGGRWATGRASGLWLYRKGTATRAQTRALRQEGRAHPEMSMRVTAQCGTLLRDRGLAVTAADRWVLGNIFISGFAAHYLYKGN